MSPDFDVVVLGGGAAGLTASGTCANLGMRTMLIERHRLGGDCTWTGCVPSKAILHAAQLRASSEDYQKRFAKGDAKVAAADFAAIMADVHTIREEIYEDADAPENLPRFGIDVVSGDSRFVDAHTLEIEQDGETRRVTFRKAIICTGGRAAPPPIPGLDETPHLTNETLFEIDRQPEHLVIVGGGPIGCEMGQAFARLGSRVTVVDRADRILGKDDADNARILQSELEADGVVFLLGADVERASKTESGIELTISVDGETHQLEGDRLLIATGRKPNIETLNLDAAGVAYTKRGVTVNDACRTSQRHIFAAGDCTGEYALTHMSEHMGKTAATNAAFGFGASIDRTGITWTTFTSPEVAQLGKTADELANDGTSFVTYTFPYTKVDRAVTEHAATGQIKLHTTKWTGKILGASIVGERAGEIASVYAVAMKGGVSAKTISDTIFAYPTYGLAARRAADQYYVQKQYPIAIEAIKRVFGYRGTTPPPPDPNRVL
ncbi:MAG: FAD-dependent oxidoreductase [Rubricoccaceae bacterium]